MMPKAAMRAAARCGTEMPTGCCTYAMHRCRGVAHDARGFVRDSKVVAHDEHGVPKIGNRWLGMSTVVC